MLYPAINLDASMTAFAALERMARYGLWLDANHESARRWILGHAEARRERFDFVAAALARDPGDFGVAIRRQWGTRILWYSRRAPEVLKKCMAAKGESTVREALDLHEPDAEPPIVLDSSGKEPSGRGVVLDGSTPIGVSVPMPKAKPVEYPPPAEIRGDTARPRSPFQLPHEGPLGGHGYRDYAEVEISRSASTESIGSTLEALEEDEVEISRSIDEVGAGVALEPEPETISAWPRIDAPDYTPAERIFSVTVGLSDEQVAGVVGERLIIPRRAGVKFIDLSIELVADGLVAEDGWTRKLSVDVTNPTARNVEFKLRGKPPTEVDRVHLTTLEVRYVFEGAVCGFASRPLRIGAADMPTAPVMPDLGMEWAQASPPTGSPVQAGVGEAAADLTIEILKPNRNETQGHYSCKLFSPHPLKTPRGPFDMDLGTDAKTFAKETVEEVRQSSGSVLIDNYIKGRAAIVAECLPREAFDALREVHKIVGPHRVPTVLIVSAEQFVPWELAEVDPPLYADRPKVLGAQAIVGRWLRDASAGPEPRPPVDPLGTMGVKDLAVMVGHYTRAQGGLRTLPYAVAEAAELENTFKAVKLEATDIDLNALIEANIKDIGAPGAVHFAGHGAFDPNRVDSSVLYLTNGQPIRSTAFRRASYGGDKQPLIFMNACMIGVGGEVLGTAGGFPGNCLKGGFGAFVGALWEVDDQLAHDIALEFWKRALPGNGSLGEPIGAILRDLRGKYAVRVNNVPVPTYLAYVYYGHPQLRLRRPAAI